jgi:hypothetical protein
MQNIDELSSALPSSFPRASLPCGRAALATNAGSHAVQFDPAQTCHPKPLLQRCSCVSHFKEYQ